MKEQLRVLMVGPARSVHGGISGVVNNYYEAGLDKKIKLCYIGTMMEGSKVKKLFVAIKAFIAYLLELPKYDIVHIHMASDNSYKRKSYFVKIAKRWHKKIVIHQHGGDFETFYHIEQTDSGRREIQKVLNMADLFLVLAPHWKTFFGEIIPIDKIIVFPDGIQVPNVYEKSYDKQRLLFLGRICKEKGICELFEAVKQLKVEFPKIHLSLGGIWEQQLQDKAMELGDTVSYLGWLSGKAKSDALMNHDIFVLPSYFEGQSVAILEAMANYCGVVATNTGGIPQMIHHKENGILVHTKDVESLKNGIRELLLQPQLCKKYGDAARKTVEEKFSLEENINRLLAFYQEL